jgi:hypothetical protein
VFALTALVLAFGNFQCVSVGWKRSLRNLLMLVSALVLGVVLTSAVYHRFWEKFTPFEPRHGAARLSLSNPASLRADWANLSLQLPDGKIWLDSFVADPCHTGPLDLILGNYTVGIAGGKYIPGTNWLHVGQSYWFMAGLKDDGTLWLSKNPPPADARISPDARNNEMSNLAQFGTETNWRSFLPLGHSLLLTKNDGTLWRLGEVSYGVKNKPWPGLLAVSPQRLGMESNWAAVFQDGYRPFFRKTDGTAWISGDWNTNDGQASIQIEPDLIVHAATAFNHNQMRGTATIEHGLQFGVGVRSDGTFRIWADERLDVSQRTGNYDWWLTDVQIGTGTNWLAVAGNGEKAVTLKNDGTLWLWNFKRNPIREWNPQNFEREVQETVPVRLGTHSDWIAISAEIALAADGSLWFWPLEDPSQISDLAGAGMGFNGNGGEPWLPLLDISRKPQLLGNVFNPAD